MKIKRLTLYAIMAALLCFAGALLIGILKSGGAI